MCFQELCVYFRHKQNPISSNDVRRIDSNQVSEELFCQLRRRCSENSLGSGNFRWHPKASSSIHSAVYKRRVRSIDFQWRKEPLQKTLRKRLRISSAVKDE